ncbi:30S ribosomal protein S9 [Candidatus Daviesbacteria bacterium RIFCSPLOWO2_01_FULL_39_12]|uniref:30S ribosomal protein S9 n=1 Tax=Candidatus Daviesbacteria bacterium RIFCSPLOWO2_01_FULL_39_12 TaxID=1797785 RepID=A0A1F5KM44_9BACT|nr:MAG: 30S ribosomal protein S9 [Candidatus Daviesbacteria bacterium RIFCSPHIGHO2_02_FULL_39_8]OGE41681.1 MAG: 30S ribosomal protein S9 [Candidatus Daviesbacteria bacterium RIFCSPLOWO2_01_FULL_39_12]
METKEKSTISAVGRRKEAVARVRLMSGKGQITINGKLVEEYFLGPIFQKMYHRPFEVTDSLGKYTVSVKIKGGGARSQLEAIILGIARALVKSDEKFKTALRKEGFLTRDARVKERRKYGHAGKARAKKQSPKR